MQRKRIFIAFAVEDETYRNFLVGQARNSSTPFDFIDMSVKEPWDRAWKTNCRTKIKGCDGVIALLSANTMRADGARWEIRCASEENIPLAGMFVKNRCAVPPELIGHNVMDWSWDNLVAFIRRL